MNIKYKVMVKGFALLGIVGLLLSCGGGGNENSGSSPISPALFIFTGGSQSFTVPNGVTTMNVDAYGASSGDGWNVDGGGSVKGRGGMGGRVQATLTVVPGQVLTIYVGATGEDATPIGPGIGGFNGGGDGQGSPFGYAGGGAAVLRTSEPVELL